MPREIDRRTFLTLSGLLVAKAARGFELQPREQYISPQQITNGLDIIYSNHTPSNPHEYDPSDPAYEQLAKSAGNYLKDLFMHTQGKTGLSWDTSITLSPGEWIVSTDLKENSIKPNIGTSYARAEYPFIVTQDIYSMDRGNGIFRVSVNPQDPVNVPAPGIALRLTPNYLASEVTRQEDVNREIKQYKETEDIDGAIDYIHWLSTQYPSETVYSKGVDLKPGQWLLAGIVIKDSKQRLSANNHYFRKYGPGKFEGVDIDTITVLQGHKVRLSPTQKSKAIYLGGQSQSQYLPLTLT